MTPRRLWLAFGGALLAVASAAEAASFSGLLLIPDGSADPPGDRIRLTVVCGPREAPFTLEVRAYTVIDGKATPVAAKRDRHRDERGSLLITERVTPPPEGGPHVVNLGIPYEDILLPMGSHQIGYEIRATRAGRTLFATATRLSQVRLTVEPRESMQHRIERPAPVPRSGHFYAFNPRGDGKVTEHTLPRPATIAPPHYGTAPSRPKFDVKEVPVTIPNGYHRELPDEPEAEPAEEAEPVTAYLVGLKRRPWAPVRDRLIYFATNRNVLAATNPPNERFGTDVAADLTYGSCLANIPSEKLHARGKLETPGWWGVDPDKHFFIEVVNTVEEAVFFQEVTAVFRTPASAGDILLFVHGYNNSFEFAVLRAAQFVHDAQFPGIPVVFSWPSMGEARDYGTDEKHATKSISHLASVIERLSAKRFEAGGEPLGKIHVIAHSMGNRVLLGALDEIAARRPNDKLLGHVVLAAPDVAVEDFLKQVPAVLKAADDVTLYFCEDDLALKASAGLHSKKRAGEGLVPLPSLVNVDAARANTTILGHDYFVSMSLLLVDLDMLINQNVTASLRQTIRGTTAQIDGSLEYPYWFFP
jgi:esterase/lipase superfamily enzyme